MPEFMATCQQIKTNKDFLSGFLIRSGYCNPLMERAQHIHKICCIAFAGIIQIGFKNQRAVIKFSSAFFAVNV